MKLDSNWVTAAILTLPYAWFIALLLFRRPIILSVLTFLFPIIIGLLFGLWFGGFIGDKIRNSSFILVIIEVILLVIGISQFLLPPDFWISSPGIAILLLLVFLFGSGLTLMTIFLNQLIPSIYRGHVAGIVTVFILMIGGILSYIWQLYYTPFAPTVTAAIILFGIIIYFFVQPHKRELHTFMVPGSIIPYAIWWILFLTAFGLYTWATPEPLRLLFNSFSPHGTSPIAPELILLGIGGATFVFTFLPDKLGRKHMFTVASVLLGILCIFGSAQFADFLPILEHLPYEIAVIVDYNIRMAISIGLTILQLFLIGFILGVGAWLVWAEVGPVRMKGRRAAFGWTAISVLGAIIWVITFLLIDLGGLALIVYPIAASLILLSVFPITNAVEVLGNERVVEELDIRVDSRKVSRALRELEVETPLKSIEDQIESELAQLAKIKGVSRTQARELRDAGFETLQLVARAKVDTITQVLGITSEAAYEIIKNAQKMSSKQSKRSLSHSSSGRSKSLKSGKTSKKRKPK
jgi:hypothetical protein